MEKSKFRVVKIIDDMNIVINCGENHDIHEGDRFYIYSNNGTPVIDPVTKEQLGSFKGIKAKVIATTVYDKMSVCQNSVVIGGIPASLSEFHMDSFIGKRASLNVDPSQISGGLNTSVNEPIRIGDEVEKIG